MPKRHKYTLNEEELKQIREAMKDLDARISKRASIVHGLHLGHRPDELDEMYNISQTSIYNHFNRFKAEGYEGLPDKARSGRLAKAIESIVSYSQVLDEAWATKTTADADWQTGISGFGRCFELAN